jgi:hypothetical protein
MKKIDKIPRLTLSGIQSYFFMSFMLFMVKFKGLRAREHYPRDRNPAPRIPHLDTLPSSHDTHLLGQPIE